MSSRSRTFEIIAVAQDTAGEAAAGEWYDRANLTYTTLIDVTHQVSSLYNLVNVPSGVWIDEEGRILRINEGTYAKKHLLGNTEFGTDAYTPAVRDWVANGADSPYVWSREQVSAKIRQRTTDEALAEPIFTLGVYFFEQGNETLARTYWERAQQLYPDNWSFHRQDWSFIDEASRGAEVPREGVELRRAGGRQAVLRPSRSPHPSGVSAGTVAFSVVGYGRYTEGQRNSTVEHSSRGCVTIATARTFRGEATRTGRLCGVESSPIGGATARLETCSRRSWIGTPSARRTSVWLCRPRCSARKRQAVRVPRRQRYPRQP